MGRDILEDIIDNFSPEKFIKFFRTKNTSFSPRQEELNQYNDDNFKDGKKLGEINSKDNSLIVYSFQVIQPLSEKSGKKSQYEKGKRILKETQNDAGIFIFYDQNNNFRFSLIYANYLGRRRDWSEFRRFTYFVSKEFTNKTFLLRIGDGDFSNLEKIKEAFSVEKITKSFYTDIANWYFWAVRNVTFPKDAEEEKNGRNIAVIRLITRLIFIWFMRERGLISKDLFDQDQLNNFLKDLSFNESTYYKAILQNLFFATLNTKTKDRKYRFQDSFQGKNKDYMDHSIYRYESYFRNQEVMLAIFKGIPFLNGGLFDCLDRRFISDGKNTEVRIDGFTDKEVGLKVPNFLFFSDLAEADLNQEYGTKNKRYSVKGIINTLSTYNFTIDENDPNDQEVALDPELLGKVFENLLASFNPETASTARNATGSYYTPREIVDYMVVQSLVNYLRSNLEGVSDLNSKLDKLFSNTDEANPFNHQETLGIVKMIDNLRIVDPAVGSGAFPMGILNKLVFILSKLDPDNTLWKKTQLQAVEDNVTDPVLKKKLLDQVEEQFAYKNFDYGRKLYLIQKCIYGADIQQIAVEIAKLRFFISLLVDEKIDQDKENWGIEPLPNLDYKIMQGNSLLEEYEGIKLFDERLLNAKLPDEKEILEIAEKLKNIDKERLQYYQKNPQWMKNTKLERPTELIVLEGERNRLQIVTKELNRLQQSGFNVNNQQQLSLQAEEDKSQKVWIELQKLHKQLFASSLTRNEKLDLKQEIDGLEWRLIQETLRKQNKIKELEKIEKLENSNTKPFFLWKLYFPEVFQEKGGFDVVIGNPPYGFRNVLTDKEKKYFREVENIEFSSGDSAELFSIKCFNNLVKENGILTFLVPKKSLYGDAWDGFRRNYWLRYDLKFLLDSSKAFENVLLETSAFGLVKNIEDSNIICAYLSKDDKVIEFGRGCKNQIFLENLTKTAQIYRLLIPDEILEKIQNNKADNNLVGGKLGLAIGTDFYSDQKTDFKLLKGIDIDRWRIKTHRWLKNKSRLDWGSAKIFLKPKVICQRVIAHIDNPRPHIKITACYDREGIIITNTLISFELDNKIDEKFWLAYLNSSFVSWYVYNFIYTRAIRTMDFYDSYIRQIPIPKKVLTDNNQAAFVEIVNKTLSITESSDYLSNSENVKYPFSPTTFYDNCLA
ncbi:hypothetical protein HYU93_02685 [Candidatus Daviesbacteria bacterium]|nr:hypothetical protein [Candidatus Daviesbacteria bacterium]